MSCQDLATGQEQLDDAAKIQRDEFPVSRLNNKTRKEVFPLIYTQNRPWDEQDFDAMRVYNFLKLKKYVRKVSSNGQITHFSQKPTIGDAYKGQYVLVTLEVVPQQQADPIIQWVIADVQNKVIRRVSANHLQKQKLLDLNVMSKN